MQSNFFEQPQTENDAPGSYQTPDQPAPKRLFL
jgi:hypothetical protein